MTKNYSNALIDEIAQLRAVKAASLMGMQAALEYLDSVEAEDRVYNGTGDYDYVVEKALRARAVLEAAIEAED